jgi:hypothetical protein
MMNLSRVGIIIEIIGVALIGTSIMLIAAFFNIDYNASRLVGTAMFILIGFSIILIGLGYGLYLMGKEKNDSPSD